MKNIKVRRSNLNLKDIKVKPKYRKVKIKQVDHIEKLDDLRKSIKNIKIIKHELYLDDVKVKPKYRKFKLKKKQANIHALDKLAVLIKQGRLKDINKKFKKRIK